MLAALRLAAIHRHSPPLRYHWSPPPICPQGLRGRPGAMGHVGPPGMKVSVCIAVVAAVCNLFVWLDRATLALTADQALTDNEVIRYEISPSGALRLCAVWRWWHAGMRFDPQGMKGAAGVQGEIGLIGPKVTFLSSSCPRPQSSLSLPGIYGRQGQSSTQRGEGK